MLGLFALLNQSEPYVELPDFILKEGREWGVRRHDVVYQVHKDNEDDNSCKLNENGEKVLNTGATSVVAVTCCRDYCADPVKGKYVQLIAVVCMEERGFDSPWIALVAHQVKISHP